MAHCQLHLTENIVPSIANSSAKEPKVHSAVSVGSANGHTGEMFTI